jgi:mRNA interferase RelE/StbE
MYKILLHKNAVKFYRNANEALRSRITDAINAISKNPYTHVHVKKLKGELKRMHRFRLGDLRIIYEIEDAEETIWIKSIEWRGAAYK